MDRATKIARIRAHALAHYADGWDVVVECYEDADLSDLIDDHGGLNGALRELRDIVESHREQVANCRFE